ncbi:MAG: FecR domain-containing protein, partial [Gammaproteobacteria bacterium]
AQIGFTDNSLMTFQANTKLFINEYVYKPKAKASVGKYILNLIEGGFRTITGMIAKKAPDDYAINTPVATIGVRGTDYRAYYHNGRLGVGWYKGTPCVTTLKDGKTICLSKDLQYVEVPDANSAAVPLKQRPDYFDQDLVIDVVNINGFDIGMEGNVITK